MWTDTGVEDSQDPNGPKCNVLRKLSCQALLVILQTRLKIGDR
jgi:hypothetical protein